MLCGQRIYIPLQDYLNQCHEFCEPQNISRTWGAPDVTIINYRKGGKAFINLVTLIPLRGGVHNMPEEADEVAYHIGFQVGLMVQPTRIFDKLRDGSYYSINNGLWGLGSISSDGRLPGMGHGLRATYSVLCTLESSQRHVMQFT